MTKVLVVANQTVGGRALLEAVEKRKGADFFLVVPRNRPRHGNVIYDEAVRDAAQVRIDLATQVMARQGIEVHGEVGDDDPFSATLDAVDEWRPDEVIVSTLPATSSGWLRRDLIERIEGATGLPVEHVVTDVNKEGLLFDVTLVVANRTVNSPELLDALKKRNEETPRLFILAVPQEGGDGLAARAARSRLRDALSKLRNEGLLCAGFIAAPNPYDATLNALETFTVSDVVISTFGEKTSGWLRGDLIKRVQSRIPQPVEHIVARSNEPVGAAKSSAA